MPETAGSAHSGRRRRKLLLLDHRPPRHQSGLTRALDQGMFTRVGRTPVGADSRPSRRHCKGRQAGGASYVTSKSGQSGAGDAIGCRHAPGEIVRDEVDSGEGMRDTLQTDGRLRPNLALHTALSTLRAISPASVNFTRPKAIGDWLPRRVAPVFHDERRASTKRHT